MFGVTRAPDFDQDGLTWFNTPHPLNLSHLRGRLLVLEFWTTGCINCLHLQPTLRRLEETHPREVQVVAVHSPKFGAERDPALLAAAIERLDIRHPVVHDPEMRLWSEYGVRAWPTLVFISPDGYVIGQMAGEPHAEALVSGIGDMVRQFWARGELSPQDLPFAAPARRSGLLRFPAKIKSSPWHEKRWAVADSGHNRVLVLDDDGEVVARYGNGEAGLQDGEAWEARFNAPQGLACTVEAIYVADTGNHALRKIDRRTGKVTTLCGTGSRGAALKGPEDAARATLASPWDVELAGNTIFVANAGTHQILALDRISRVIRPYAGSGVEDLADGPGVKARLAQPSGLGVSGDGKHLYFVDAESSALRRVGIGDKGKGKARVETLAGKGLFDFGHENGALADALFQHPQAIAACNGSLMVADSYNGAIRKVDLAAGSVADLVLSEFDRGNELPLSEPGGVAIDGGDRLLVADSNNHRIVEIRLDQRRIRTFCA